MRSKLLANEALKKRYLLCLKKIASEYLNWDYMGPKVEAARKLIGPEVKADTRKLMTYDEFRKATFKSGTLRNFCKERSEYLLNHPEIKDLESED